MIRIVRLAKLTSVANAHCADDDNVDDDDDDDDALTVARHFIMCSSCVSVAHKSSRLRGVQLVRKIAGANLGAIVAIACNIVSNDVSTVAAVTFIFDTTTEE